MTPPTRHHSSPNLLSLLLFPLSFSVSGSGSECDDTSSSASSDGSALSDEWHGWSDSPAKSTVKHDVSASTLAHNAGEGLLQTGAAGGSFRARRGRKGERGAQDHSKTPKDWQVVEEEKRNLTRVRKPPPDWGTVDDSSSD